MRLHFVLSFNTGRLFGAGVEINLVALDTSVCNVIIFLCDVQSCSRNRNRDRKYVPLKKINLTDVNSVISMRLCIR